MPRNIPIQFRRGTSTQWDSSNPVLSSGEPGFDITNNIIKVGDGTSSWTSLSGLAPAPSGNFTTLLVNSVPVSITGHTHTSSEITDFNSSVSGLFSKTIGFFTASDNQPPLSGYATLDTRNSIMVLDFDAAASETGIFLGVIPHNASVSNGLNIRINWMASTATSGNCVWATQFENMNTDLDTDSFSTPAASGTTTTNATAGIPSVTSITNTNIDSLIAGDFYRLRVYRDATVAADTMAGDAELISIELRTV